MSLTEAQLQERYSGIGGSDAAAALGLSPWKSALELFLDKREKRVTVVNDAMRWGNLLEPVLRQEYANRTGRLVRVPPGTLRHAKHAFMVAHFDGVTDDQRIFEAKTARSPEGWGDHGTDEVPPHYYLQVQHYLAVSGFAIADVAVLIGGSDFRVYEIAADPGMQADMIDGEQAFWNCVERGEPPTPDFNTGNAMEVIKRLYPGTDGSTVQASLACAEFRRVYEHSHNYLENYKRVADGAKAHLLAEMKDAACMTFPDGVQLTRKMIQRKGYEVKPTSYIDARFSRIKETA